MRPIGRGAFCSRKKEIAALAAAESKKGLTIIPLEVYTAGRFVKARVAIVRGKGKADRREDLKKRDAEPRYRTRVENEIVRSVA